MAISTAPADTLARWHGRHAGATIVVCGCGTSARLLAGVPRQRRLVVGVNDIGRLFDPTYLVVVNPKSQFSAERFAAIEHSRAEALFTQLDLGCVQPPVVRFRLGRHGGTDVGDPGQLHYTQNSPYVAVNLAALLGARRIGLIGVDFTDDHFFAATGRHALTARLSEIDAQYARLALALRQRGVELVNLSAGSRLTALPKAPLAWLEAAAPATCTVGSRGLRVVSYATTPVAGVPAVLARCIGAATADSARCVWAARGYGNGVEFEGDVEWPQQPREAMALLADADAVIVHNGKVDAAHRKLLDGKPVLTMAHNYGWNVDMQFVRRGLPGAVVGQYQVTLPEFAGWAVVPNPVALWEPAHALHDKPADAVHVAYTPSGRHERYPAGHRLYWHGKGYATTLAILDRLTRRHGIRALTTAAGPVSHAESLALKRRAHIVIDECVTGSYHRNSLEGLAAGCVVVNGVGLLDGVAQALAHCSGNVDADDAAAAAVATPFVRADLQTLEAALSSLIAQGPAALAATGRRNRDWMDVHWHFGHHWQRLWRPLIERTIDQHRRPHRNRSSRAMEPEPNPQPGLTVVVPFGGRPRLQLLATTLAGLAQSPAVRQIVVAECGAEPVALAVARRWDADHVFIADDGPFDKARALNTGSRLALADVVLWCDGDLLFGDRFVESALHEFRSRALDFMFPFAAIHYVGREPTRDVCAGTRSPADVRPLRVLQPWRGGAIGGMGLVRAGFLRRVGGLVEGFKGWGGEDNAWVHKATLLGRVDRTGNAGQLAWHLYHPDSGATGAEPWRHNPHYRGNVALLRQVQSVRSAAEMLRRFPPPSQLRPPWPAAARIAFVTAGTAAASAAAGLASDWARRLEAICGCRIAVRQVDADGASSPGERLGVGSDAAGTDPVFGATTDADGEADAVVAFATDASDLRRWATRLRGRRAVLVPATAAPDGKPPCADNGAGFDGWLLVAAQADVQRWRHHGWRVWHRPYAQATGDAGAAAAVDVLPVIVQPLSRLLGAPTPATAAALAATTPLSAGAAGHAAAATTAAPTSPPTVWAYWEGAMPDWIERCLATARGHAPTLRVLGPAEFDALRDRDRDIDLSALHVAQRADYVRAFLLARFGGWWLDVDCIVMRDLRPLLARLTSHEFIAHRERQGLYSNAFIGARPGSALAARFHAVVRERLRGRRPLGWIALGNEPLTEVLAGAPPGTLLELPVDQVQPICWSEPQRYFRRGADADHDAALNRDAWCYMLSQQNLLRHQRSEPAGALLDPRSLFSFLLRRSLQPPLPAGAAALPPAAPAAAFFDDQPVPDPADDDGLPPPADAPLAAAFEAMRVAHAAQGHESVSGPGSSLRQTAELRQRLPLLLQQLDARVLLDAPCGDLHWMSRVRLGVAAYIGVDLLPGLIDANRRRHGEHGRRFLVRDLLVDKLPRADVVLCRDCLGHLCDADVVKGLRNFVASGATWLLTTTFAGRPPAADIRNGQWRPLNLQAAPFCLPPPLCVIDEKCSESAGAFKDKGLGLWRLADLRVALAIDPPTQACGQTAMAFKAMADG